MDVEIGSIQSEIAILKADLKAKTNRFAILKASPTTKVMRDQIQEMKQRKEEISERLSVLKAENIIPVSKRDKQQVEDAHTAAKMTYERRKKIFWNMWQVVLDTYEGDREELWVSRYLCCALFLGL